MPQRADRVKTLIVGEKQEYIRGLFLRSLAFCLRQDSCLKKQSNEYGHWDGQ
jgi:hypothetical protein